MGDLATGRKDDQEKPRWDLLHLRVVEETVKVLTFGSKKYSDHNWQIVPGARNRYFAALMRHLSAWQAGKLFDEETGLLVMAHVACNAFFLLWFDLFGDKNPQPKDQDGSQVH